VTRETRPEDRSGLDGKTALVTGASAGIGRETVYVLARHGANVVLAARRASRLREIAATAEDDYGAETLVVPTDVTDEADVDEMVVTTVDEFGTLDIVVNNAGTGTEPGVTVDDLETNQYRTVMAVNTDGMFFTTRAALPHLRDSSGLLIFVGNFAGRFPRSRMPIYAATKWWTRGFALSLAGQVGDDDVGITVVNPSEVRTEFGKEFRSEAELSKERYDPGEVTEPTEVAKAIAFAARQESPDVVSELDLYRRDKFSGF
jgi:NADP-dependent 3-hydroxy acid dehydrogenase YdfG